MPICCRCNGSGHCRSCACVKSGTPCVDCLPSRKGHCSNAPTPASHTTTPVTDNGHCLSSSTNADTSTTANELDTQDICLSPDRGRSVTMDDVTTESSFHRTRSLPTFEPALSMTSPWGDLLGEEFTKAISEAYAQVVHWRPNLFKIPSGACGKQFVTVASSS